MRWVRRVAFFGAVIAFLIYSYRVWHLTRYSDFSVYYKAALQMADGHWDKIYTLSDGASPFRYAPLFLPLFRPLAWFDAQVAQQIWYYLQCLAFIGAYYFSYLTLKKIDPKNAANIISISFLMTARLMLDSFMIGQVASFMLLGYAISLWAWLNEKPALSGAALLIPTTLKIGPGFSYLFFPFQSLRSALRAWGMAAILCLVWVILIWWWMPSTEVFQTTWSGWKMIVTNDSNYIDSAHYGSQSVLSFFLRVARAGLFTEDWAIEIARLSSLLLALGILFFWAKFKASSIYEKAVCFSLGIFPYLWFMPQTFKYSQHMILLPLSLLVLDTFKQKESGKISKRNGFALLFYAVTVSIAGKDVLGATFHEISQKTSLPMFATFFVAYALVRNYLAASITPQAMRSPELPEGSVS